MTPWTAQAIRPLPILITAVMPATESALAAQEPGESSGTATCLRRLVVQPPGSFVIGAPDSEAGRWKNEGPQQQVTIDYAFAVRNLRGHVRGMELLRARARLRWP